ncbi:hypothetical protein KQX54_013751 [Cotesia glomerata]|uniref:Uncharacterized protein n=1 Tax=Cotesia glomerata TaxID=32391 RepID=A0AAV7HWI9_COTGL|nr:hypothetical protein KQX54_013751 [Cotesia glomerata]
MHDIIDRVAEGLTTGASCKHSYHADCAVVRLNVNSTRVAGVKLQTKCPTCIVTDDRVVTFLESIDQKLGGFGAKLDKVADEVMALRTDFSKLKAEQTATNTRVDAVSAKTNDVNATELKLSAADEAVLLRAACDQVVPGCAYLELLEATLLLERDLRLLRESPRLTIPFPVILKCLSL